MKKMNGMLLILMLTLSFSSCGERGANVPSDSDKPIPSPRI